MLAPLRDGLVSRKHAQLECDGGTFLLRDLGSTNGTHVDDQPVKLGELDQGAEFRLGHTRLLLVLSARERGDGPAERPGTPG